MFKREIRSPIWALVLMSAGGLLLHVRIHPPQAAAFNWIPLVVTLFNIFVLPFLFNRRGTAPAAYAINWGTVIVGTVTMAFHSAANFEGDVTFTRIFTHTTFPDILILAARLPIGEVIMNYWHSVEPHAEAVETSEAEPLVEPEPPCVPVVAVSDMSPGGRTALRAIFITLFLGLLTLAAWMDLQHYTATIDSLGRVHGHTVIAGRLAAMFATILIMVQFVLGARLKPLDEAFGLDKILKFHRATGTTAVVLATLHPILIYITPQYALGAIGDGIWPEGLGALALAALVVIAVTSIWRKFLNLSYEAWHRIHYLAFVVVILVGAHSLIIGSDMQGGWAMWTWIALLGAYLLLFVWARMIRPRLIMVRKWRIDRVAPVSHDTWELDLTPRGHSGVRHLPGQFAFLTIHYDDRRDERHPFTIASPPREDGSVSFTIKESGDYTARIGETPEGAHAIVEAAYGQFSHLRHGGDRLLMIAGGVGITPMLSMLRYMAAHGDERPVTLIWGNRTEADILFPNELEGLQEQLELRIVHVLSQQPDYDGETGYIDENVLDRVLSEEELLGEVYLCGPQPMMDLVDEALRALGVEGSRIHSERFEL
ncbi:MAG: ferric reductase-like transmembrane domain-containing protein [Armatimonadota bacterium]